MSLKDKRDQLAGSENSSEKNPQGQSLPREDLRANLKERQKLLADDVAKQNRLKSALEQGEKFYQESVSAKKPAFKESSLLSAKNMFEAAQEIDRNDPLAREGMIRVLNAFGDEAKRSGRYKMALDFYETLEKEYEEPTATIIIEEIERLIEKDKKRTSYFMFGGGVLAIVLLGFLAIQGLHLIAWPMDVCNGFGGDVLCLPTITPTSTLPPTTTPTLPFTPTPSLTPTFTPTITATATPFVYQGRLNYIDSLVPYYPEPKSSMPSGFESNGQFVYVCAKDDASNRYLISLDFCFSRVSPLGWVNKRALVLIFEGDLPPALTTPSR